MNKMDCVICDIDGTVADNRHRLHFLDARPKRWADFFDAIPGDKPRMPAILICRGLAAIGMPVIICSGRPESHRKQTEDQLSSFMIRYERLFMRKKGDGRKDEQVKKDMLDEIRALGFNPLFSIDDRPTVINMWRNNGVPVLIAYNSSWETDQKESKVSI